MGRGREGEETGATAFITSLDPAQAAIGGPDVTLNVNGFAFLEGDTIVFNGGEEPTTFVSGSLLTTGVKPSTATTPGSYEVLVRTAYGDTPPFLFTFTEAEPVPETSLMDQLKQGDTSGLATASDDEVYSARQGYENWAEEEVVEFQSLVRETQAAIDHEFRKREL